MTCCSGVTRKTDCHIQQSVIVDDKKNRLLFLQNICHVALGIFAIYRHAALTVAAFAIGFVFKAAHIWWYGKVAEGASKDALPLCAIGYANFLFREALNDESKVLLTALGIADCIHHNSPFLISLVGAGAGCILAGKLFL